MYRRRAVIGVMSTLPQLGRPDVRNMSSCDFSPVTRKGSTLQDSYFVDSVLTAE